MDTAAGGGDAGLGRRRFVGRERQLELLAGALDDALAGRGRLLLVGGEPGIGKTRLAEELARRAAERGARVLWGRCWEAGGAPAYWPWIQALRTALADRTSPEVEALVGDGAPQLAQLLPELRDRLTDVPEPAPASPESARFELFVAVGRMLARASQREPLVLVLEDLHSADEPSLLLLRFAATAISDARVVVLATYRDIELTREHALAVALPELQRAQGAGHVPMSGLTEHDVASLIVSIAGVEPSAGLVEAVHRKTEGNPLFVGEFVRLLESEDRLGRDEPDLRVRIPEGIREVIGRRLERLSHEARAVLAVAAVAGREFRVETLERTTGLRAGDVLATLHEAITSRLVEEVYDDPGSLRFSHALVRDTVYDELAPVERRRLHASVAEALERAHETNREINAAELAHHFFESGVAGDAAKTVSYATAAGRRAVQTLAYEEAVRLFRMALSSLQESPEERARCEVLVLLGDALARAGNQPESKETFLTAAAIATRVDDATLLARSALGYSGRFPWARAGNDRHLIALLRQALDALPADDDPLRVRLLARLAGALRDQHATEPRAAIGEEAVAMARRLGEPETLTYALLGWWGAALLGPDTIPEQFVVADELDELAERIGDRELRTNAVWVRYIAALTQADIWVARQQRGLLDQHAAELQQAPQLWYAGVMATAIALQDGRLAEAERLIEETLAIGHEAQAWDAEAAHLFALFVLRREQGRLTEIEQELREAVTTHPGYRMLRSMTLAVLIDTGRIDEARALYDQLAADAFAAFPKDNEWLFALTLLSESAAALGDESGASSLYELLAPYGDLVALAASEVSGGPVHRPLGVLAAALGRFDTAAEHFEAAIELCERMGARPWAAHTRFTYAAMLTDRGRPDDRSLAVELARAARATAAELGMDVLQRRVDAFLGEPADKPRPASTEQSRLTRREREVAVLVASGLSNRGIAERLVVSERTAETHVQNILTKLGFTSRSQVAAWAVREGLDEAT